MWHFAAAVILLSLAVVIGELARRQGHRLE